MLPRAESVMCTMCLCVKQISLCLSGASFNHNGHWREQGQAFGCSLSVEVYRDVIFSFHHLP